MFSLAVEVQVSIADVVTRSTVEQIAEYQAGTTGRN
jgi:hypothetical protein